MIVQNIPNSTNFGSITKYRVKAKDLEHFQANIYKKFDSGANFVFAENVIHTPTIQKITKPENFSEVHEALEKRGYSYNDSFRLNSKNEHYNIYLVNEDKDIELLHKQTNLRKQFKHLFHLSRKLLWARSEIKPQNDFDKQVAQTLGVLKFTDELSEKFEQLTKKHGMREFDYSVRKNGAMALKELNNPIDGVRFRMKTSDADEFVDSVTEKMGAALKRQNKEQNFIVENPRYIEYEEKFTELQFGNWASQNLNYRGYQTAIPVGENPQAELDFYVFTSEKANKTLKNKFEGFKSVPEYVVDTVKAKSVAEGFSNEVDGAQNDIHFTDAYNFLYEHELNRLQNERFQKVLKTMNIRDVEYKPRKKQRVK
jgi:hypothetical protein